MGASGDPDAEVPEWLRSGAPAGIGRHPKLRGIFPPKEQDDSDKQPRRKLTSYTQCHRTYTSVEEDEAAIDEIKKLTSNARFINTCRSDAETCKFLNAAPVVSKLAMCCRLRPNAVSFWTASAVQ